MLPFCQQKSKTWKPVAKDDLKLIGVKDNGSITGINSAEEYHMLEAAANMYCRPEIHFKAKEWNISVLKYYIVSENPRSCSK